MIKLVEKGSDIVDDDYKIYYGENRTLNVLSKLKHFFLNVVWLAIT